MSVLVCLYLGSVVAANFAVALYGARALALVAVLGIGLDLTLRDALHARWERLGRAQLALRMGALIATGSVLSALVAPGTLRVAGSSCLAFAVSAAADTAVYDAARARKPFHRVVLSNLAGAAVDSLVFPLAAFGTTSPRVLGSMFAAKVLGGAVWAWVLGYRP